MPIRKDLARGGGSARFGPPANCHRRHFLESKWNEKASVFTMMLFLALVYLIINYMLGKKLPNDTVNTHINIYMLAHHIGFKGLYIYINLYKVNSIITTSIRNDTVVIIDTYLS